MTLFIKERRSILFLHVPKCGGSSIEKLFKDNGYSSTLELRGLPPQDCLVASPQHLTSENLKSMVNMERLDNTFILVRNPYKRIVSEFNWQFRDAEPSNTPDINTWIIESLEKASNDLCHSDNHFRPGIDFIDSNHPCNIFKLEDGIEFVVEYFIRKHSSTKEIAIPNEKNAKSFAKSINAPNLNPITITTINHFYQHDFEAFGYPMIGTATETSKFETNSKNKNLVMDEKIKTIKEWRDKTINNLSYKTQKELRLLDKQITEIGNGIDKDDWPERLHHDEIRKSIDSRFDEILVKLNYRLLDLKLLESQEQTITSSQASNLIKLANAIELRQD